MTHPGFKLGRLARGHNPAIPHLSALVAGQTLPPPPPSVDYTAQMPANLGMMMNDTLGESTVHRRATLAKRNTRSPLLSRLIRAILTM